MPVPKATMDKDGRAVLRQDHIGPAGNAFDVQPVPETTGMQRLSDQQLRPGICRPDRCHVPATGFPIMNISQRGEAMTGERPPGYAGA